MCIRFVITLMHQGMVYVGLPYVCPELAQARFQGRHVASIAKKLSA